MSKGKESGGGRGSDGLDLTRKAIGGGAGGGSLLGGDSPMILGGVGGGPGGEGGGPLTPEEWRSFKKRIINVSAGRSQRIEKVKKMRRIKKIKRLLFFKRGDE